MGLLGGLGLAGVFYAAAEYEHMTGWKWALASVAVSATVRTVPRILYLRSARAVRFVLYHVVDELETAGRARGGPGRQARRRSTHPAGPRAARSRAGVTGAGRPRRCSGRPRRGGFARAAGAGATLARRARQGETRRLAHPVRPRASCHAVEMPSPIQSRSSTPNSRASGATNPMRVSRLSVC